eukprot:m.33083 g.33083  ORF g.33083 m.33083 type:complete len:641 (-) comp7152_c0_seq1:130-2052(-)
MASSIKIFYARQGLPDDVRRFKLDHPLDFNLFATKVLGLFGVVSGQFTWKDEDGDSITIGNTDDLLEATRSCPGTLKVYFTATEEIAVDVAVDVEAPVEVEASSPASDGSSTDGSEGWEQVTRVDEEVEVAEATVEVPPVETAVVEETVVEEVTPVAAPEPTAPPARIVHPRVQCDITGMFPIVGNRWQKRGEDYDLCDAAFNTLLESEKAHFDLIATPNAVPVPYNAGETPVAEAQAAPAEATNDAVHVGVKCDLSGMVPIVGNRWHLIGHNYDVCQAEFEKLPKEQQQRFELIAKPGDRGAPFGYPMRFTRDGDAAEQAAALLRTVLTALQDNYSVEIDLVPRGNEGAHHRGPVQAEVPIQIDTTDGQVTVDVDTTQVPQSAPAAASPVDETNPAAATPDSTDFHHGHFHHGQFHGFGHRQRHHKHGRRGRNRRAVPVGEVLPAAPLSQGMCGEGVSQLQDVLVRHGFLTLDAISLRQGFFGPRTAAAVRGFQVAHRLRNRSGVLDEATRDALLKVEQDFQAVVEASVASAAVAEAEAAETARAEAESKAEAEKAAAALNEQLSARFEWAAAEAAAQAERAAAEAAAAAEAEAQRQPTKWAEEIAQLKSMGFENVDLLMPILDRTNGHVDAVIAALLD